MRQLSREIVLAIVSEYGPDEVLRRLSDPVWFQAFGCVLGFDWHSSGVTTTVCGALKEGLRGLTHESGLIVAGGKGGASRKTPDEIRVAEGHLRVDPAGLVRCSKLSAKVDSAALQDGYELYHHTFVFTPEGRWTVVQQGMNAEDRTARRYHWLGEHVDAFAEAPHEGIASEARVSNVLDLTAEDSGSARGVVTALASETPEGVLRDYSRLLELRLPRHHDVRQTDMRPENLRKALIATYEAQPAGFEALLEVPGVGAKSLRALALIGEIVHGTPASHSDPALFSFAHGGKDGYPYPVDRETYDRDIGLLRDAVRAARAGRSDKLAALKRLSAWEGA